MSTIVHDADRPYKVNPLRQIYLTRPPQWLDLQTYAAILALYAISLWTGRKPTLRTFEMLCWYFTGMASPEELLAHIPAACKKRVEPPKAPSLSGGGPGWLLRSAKPAPDLSTQFRISRSHFPASVTQKQTPCRTGLKMSPGIPGILPLRGRRSIKDEVQFQGICRFLSERPRAGSSSTARSKSLLDSSRFPRAP